MPFYLILINERKFAKLMQMRLHWICCDWKSKKWIFIYKIYFEGEIKLSLIWKGVNKNEAKIELIDNVFVYYSYE